jgi:phage terminase large subunit-like protein
VAISTGPLSFGPGPTRLASREDRNDVGAIAAVPQWGRATSGLVLPRYESPISDAAIEAGDGQRVIEFADAYGRIHKDSIGGKTGEHIHWLPWQVRLIFRIYARDPETGKRLARRYLVGVARKNGKTALAAVLALYMLLLEGDGAEVYSCAADREQAKLAFGAAKRMVELDPELSEIVKPYRDALEFTQSGSVYKALSAEAFTKEGLSPSGVIFDELHAQPTRELYDVMSLGMGAREDPLMVAITTAGVMADRYGNPTICKSLYEYGKQVASGEVVDPSFGFTWYEPLDTDADPSDPDARLQANPSLGTVLDPADLDSALPPQTPENEYRTKRLNCWVSGHQAWLPHGTWAAREAEKAIEPDEQVVLAFDGSWTNDSTAIVGIGVESKHIFVVDAWERPPEAQAWVVPSDEVERSLFDALDTYNVVEVACDPAYWREHLQQWAESGAPIVEWPPTATRMTPATREFYTAVIEDRLTHDGDPRLARHVANAVLKTDWKGSRIVKQQYGQKIDLAVAAVMAHSRALTYEDSGSAEFVPW